MFKIQNATIADIPLIRELTFNVWPQTYGSILSPQQIEYMLEMMYSEVSLQQQIEEGSHFIIAYDHEEPVGFASYQETEPQIFKLHKLYILPSLQGKGIGKFVLDHIISDIKRRNAKALQLQVNRYNKAKDFYQKLGFVVLYQADFEIGNGYFMNDYVMEKKL